MNKKVVAIIAILLIIAGTIFGFVAKTPEEQFLGFAVALFSAGGACAKMWKERTKEKPDFVTIASIVLTGVGSFFAGLFIVMGEAELTTIIKIITSLCVVIAGILLPLLKKRE